MRIARITLAAALVALTALALTATAANATYTPTVEVTDEASTNECSDITEPTVIEGDALSGSPEGPVEGGCQFGLEGEVLFEMHLFGIEMTLRDCEYDVGLRIDSGGEGWADSFAGTNHPGLNDCNSPACQATSGMQLWPFHIDWTGDDPVLRIEACTVPSSEIICEISLTLTMDGHNLSWSGTSEDATNHLNAPNCEFSGTLQTTAGDIEIAQAS